MKHNHLKTAVLLGLAMSLSSYSAGMAAEITGPIVADKTQIYQEDVTITNGNSDHAAIQIGHKDNETDTPDLDAEVNISTEKGHNIMIDSKGYGIRTENASTGTIQLNSSGNNVIQFGSGSGISADSKVGITLSAAGTNSITYKGNSSGDAETDDYDGINAGVTNTGDIALIGDTNTIAVGGSGSDGIYTAAGSPSDVALTAEEESNTITAGNNGIDHRGSGTVKLQAANGGNLITAGEGQTTPEGDGVRIEGNGKVVLTGQYNTISAADDGLYIKETSGENASISVTASGANENTGVGNYIEGNRGIAAEAGAIDVIGMNTVIEANKTGIEGTNGNIAVVDTETGETPAADSQLQITVDSEDAAYGIYRHGMTEGNSQQETAFGESDIKLMQDAISIEVNGKNSASRPTVSGVYSVINSGDLHLMAGNGGLTISATADVSGSDSGSVSGIYAQDSAVNTFESTGDIKIESQFTTNGNASGIYTAVTTSSASDTAVTVAGNNVSISAGTHNGSSYGIQTSYGDKAQSGKANSVTVTAENSVSIHTTHTDENATSGNSNGINVGGGTVNVTAKNGSTIIKAERGINGSIGAFGVYAGSFENAPYSSVASINSYLNNEIDAGNAVHVLGQKSEVTIKSIAANNKMITSAAGLVAYQGSKINLQALKGENNITAEGSGIIAADYYGFGTDSNVLLEAKKNTVGAYVYGIRAAASSDVTLTASDEGNHITVSKAVIDDKTGEEEAIGINADTEAIVTLNAERKGNNRIQAGAIDGNGYGDRKAINALSGSMVNLQTETGYNLLSGAVNARNAGTNVSLTGTSNQVYSAAVISDAGDLNTSGDSDMREKQVISALYAEDGADITVSGQNNTFRTTADPNNPDQLERVIWAYNGADINIDGTTLISTDSYKESPNSADIAIAAGTAVNLKKEDVEDAVANPASIDHAVVTVNYDSYADNEGNTVASSITGDIVSAYAGQVNIKKQDGAAANAKINIEGNLLAGNGGILNVDLGNGGVLEGRADDYGDAGVVTTDSSYGEDGSFRHPAFSSNIYKGGAVNLTMGEGARWNVTGQSWVTSINTEEAETIENVLNAEDPIKAMKDMATIDLVSANTDQNQYAHAMTIYEMKGDAVFNMSLDGNRDVSDMLYMKKADGSYIINVVESVTLDDMYAIRENGKRFDGLRFATVGEGSDVSFRAVTIGDGVLNVEYEVGTDSYDNNEENEEYNSTAEDGTASGNSEKPGDAMVDGFFESDGTPVGSSDDTTSSANYMVLSETDTEEETQDTGAINYKLIGRADEQFSNAGQTIIDMSRVNYSNAVYMDRLNKRMGEARYIDGDDGLWVRLRHDRIGKEDAFRSMNTMFELGYDRKVQDQKDGEHRRGVAFDYMRGEANYTNVMGSGDVRRAGVWLYDTWLGDKGHYSDYVVKYGRLSNDFDIFNELGTKVSGDYDNDVWSASAEYGRKKDIGNEWYFEPQAQLQYAYVTSADYTTSQNTKVSLDGIDSLIGRAGFRLGRDTSEGNTVYFKADILHEFLGDQRVYASDITGALDTTYDNEGTWYDVGFGFSHRMGEDSYMFLDVEHSFGNDNEDTYQINIGLNRAF